MKSWGAVSTVGVTILLFGLSSVSAGLCEPGCAWGYGPKDGPHRWADLCCPVCEGAAQSPIDILTSRARVEELPAIELSYTTSHLELANNGRTIHASDELQQGENTIVVGGVEYAFSDLHFHSLSEHTLDQRHTPLEMHLVHERTSYDLAVIAVMIEEGEPGEAFSPIWNSLPTDASIEPRTVILNPKKLLPKDLSYFTYRGSLTTPNCSEVVTWYVLQEPVTMSIEQIEAFREIFDSNFRPTQPWGSRFVRRSR